MLELELSIADLANTRFALSPLWEVVASVRVLKSPAEHALHRRWIAHARPRLAAARPDLRLLMDLVPVPTRVLPAFLAPPPRSSTPDLEVELAALAATSAETIRTGLDMRPEPRTADLDRLYRDPRAVLPELVETIRTYWELVLAPFWPRIKSLCDNDVHHRSRLLAESGTARMFRELSPEVTWRDGVLSIEYRTVSRRTSLEGRGLLLVPSVFIAPRIFSVVSPPWQPTIRYPPRGIALLWSPARRDTSKNLAALLGEGRARVLSALDSPLSTTELAARSGLTAGGVSQHLSVLHAAGLVERHRSGRYVLYNRALAAETLLTAAAEPG